jgi:hypothetical protein
VGPGYEKLKICVFLSVNSLKMGEVIRYRPYMRRALAALLCLLVSKAALSQTNSQHWKRYRAEVSLGAGPSMFLGELGGSNSVGTNYFKDLNFMATRYAISAGIRYKISTYFAVKTSLSYGRLYGDDKFSEEFFRNNRNLNFRTNLFEWNTTVEASLLKESLGHRYRLRGPVGRRAYQIYSYVFAGIGLFYFNPQGYYKGRWYLLRPLSTEGQGLVPTRKLYSQVQLCIPVGIGFKYTIDQRWGVGVEFGYRSTFTDYIDDVSQTYFDYERLGEEKGYLSVALSDKSVKRHPEVTAAGQQRGNPNNTDAYMFSVISVNYRLRTSQKFRFRSNYYKDMSPMF